MANIIPLFIRDFSCSSQIVSVTEKVPPSQTSPLPLLQLSYNLIVLISVSLLVCIKFPAANLPVILPFADPEPHIS